MVTSFNITNTLSLNLVDLALKPPFHTLFCCQKTREGKSYNRTVDGVERTLHDIELLFIVIFDSEEIKFVYQEKAYPFWSLGAEVGGYVGMFLGYSIMQLPDLINTAFITFMNIYRIIYKQLF